VNGGGGVRAPGELYTGNACMMHDQTLRSYKSVTHSKLHLAGSA